MIVKLVGTVSNPNGIGARVRVVFGDRIQVREVTDPIGGHFGFGSGMYVDSLVVCWPGGTVQTFTDVSANQAIEVMEGEEAFAVEYRTPICTEIVVLSEADVLPGRVALTQNVPNPFNATTRIGYRLPRAGDVRFGLYNILGQEIRVLTETKQEKGTHLIHWDGRDREGRAVGSGVYFYRLTFRPDGRAGSTTERRKMLLLR